MADRFVTLEGADQAIANLRALGRQGAVALRQATNDTARYGRTLLVRSVVSSLNLRPSYVRDRVDLQLASGANLQARIITRKRDVLLERFGAKQIYKSGKGSRAKSSGKRRRAGVSVQVKAGGSREVMEGAFFVTLKNGVRAVALREYQSGRGYTGRRYAGGGGKKGNLAIDVLYGPSVIQHFRLKMPEISASLATKFAAEATRQYERRLPK